MTDPIDLSRLHEFSDGSDDGLRQLAELFMTHMTEARAALGPAVANARADVVRREAHKAAGTAGACGARRLGELLTTLERLAEKGIDGTVEVLAEIDDELARVRTFLEAHRDARQTDVERPT
jgi:HPt (histidine-containing phosphotransfer) domain-containing protein